jgi:MOSC domain-containing protein YiiM
MPAASPSASGTVYRLHRKAEVPGERGLPKSAVPQVRVSASGVEGDYNRWRQEEKGGDPDYALLLLPLETIEQLNREGWPIRPGDLGENVTTKGVPYEALAPPRRVRLGSVVAQVSKACDPCDNLYRLPYVGAQKGPEFLRTTLHRRGWYARVIRPGEIRSGDPVELLPSTA